MRGRVGLVLSSICTWWSSYVFVGNIPVLFYGNRVVVGTMNIMAAGSGRGLTGDQSDTTPSPVALRFH